MNVNQLVFGLNQVAFSFLVIMLVIFISGVVLTWFNRKNTFTDYLTYIPNALTSIGILGTFTGIVIGLSTFNLNEIDASIAALLDGLKTAFITSIFGMFLSIMFRLVSYILPKPDGANSYVQSEKTVDDLYEILSKSLAFQQENQALIIAQNEKQQSFYNEFGHEFSQKFTNQIVEQLNVLVDTFNENLQNHFGDNLKSFSANFSEIETVFDNAEKQISRQQQVLDLQQQRWEESQSNFESFADVIGSVNEGVKKLSQTHEVLIPIYDKQMEQFKVVQKDSEIFSLTLSQLNELLPNMGNKMSDLENCISLLSNELTDNLLQFQTNFQTQSIKQHELFEENISNWTQSVEKTQQDFSLATEAIERFIEQTQNIESTSFEKMANLNIDQYEQSLNKHTALQQTLHQQISDSLSGSIEQHLQNANSFSGSQHEKIEQLMQRELDAVFKQMGDALGEISGQFTRDYELIIQQMQQVLQQNQALIK